MQTLTLELVSHGGTKAGFHVPAAVVDALGGGGRPKVVATVGSFTWRSSIAVMGGEHLLGMSTANRAAAGVEPGQVLELTLALDDAPRVVEVPADLAEVLAAAPGAATAWAGWSFTRQQEAERQLTEAKKPETRAARLAKIRTALGG